MTEIEELVARVKAIGDGIAPAFEELEKAIAILSQLGSPFPNHILVSSTTLQLIKDAWLSGWGGLPIQRRNKLGRQKRRKRLGR